MGEFVLSTDLFLFHMISCTVYPNLKFARADYGAWSDLHVHLRFEEDDEDDSDGEGRDSFV